MLLRGGRREASAAGGFSEVPQFLISETRRGRLVHGVEGRVVVARGVVGQRRVARDGRRERVVATVLGHLVQLQVRFALVGCDDAVDREGVA